MTAVVVGGNVVVVVGAGMGAGVVIFGGVAAGCWVVVAAVAGIIDVVSVSL